MFKELVEKRRSIRKYKSDRIKQEELKIILESALKSPTGKNLDSLQFILIEDEKILDELSYFKSHGAGFLKGAKAAIAVLTDKELAPVTYNQDACIAATVIQFQAEDLDIGSCWANVRGATNDEGRISEDVIREALEIPAKYNVECIIGLGYKAEIPSEKRKKEFESHVHYEKF